MTWKEIFAGFGLDKCFANGMAVGVKNNRLLLVDFDDVNARCGHTGAELLADCVDLWRDDSPDGGKFVTFSKSAGMIIYDPDTFRIRFGEWSIPTLEGSVTYDSVIGEVVYDNAFSNAPCIFDSAGNPADYKDIVTGTHGYARFSELPEQDFPGCSPGFFGAARIEMLVIAE